MKTYTKQECADHLGVPYSRVKTLQEDMKQLPDGMRYFQKVRNGYSVNEAGMLKLKAMIKDRDIRTEASDSLQSVSKQEIDSLRQRLEAIQAEHRRELNELKAEHAAELLEIQNNHYKQFAEMNEKLLEQMNRLTLINVRQLQAENKPRLIDRIKDRFSKDR